MMTASPPRFAHLLLPVLALVGTVSTGCTHFANVTAVDAPDGQPTFVSSRSYRDGTPRTVITERLVSSDDPCDLLEVRSEFFAPDGLLAERVVELRRCGVVERSTVDHFDLEQGRHVRVTRRDADHDGEFEEERVYEKHVTAAAIARLTPRGQP